MRIIAFGLLMLTCGGCFFGSTYNVRMETEPTRIAAPLESGRMRDAIVEGARRRDWAVKSERPGCVTLTLLVRGGKHEVTVDVPYTEDSFSIRYVDSVNMDYDPSTGEIRKKYIQWVRNLKQDIFRAASYAR